MWRWFIALLAFGDGQALLAATRAQTPRLPPFFIETTAPRSRPEFLAGAPHLRVRFHNREQQIAYGKATFGLHFIGASPDVKMEPLHPQSGAVNVLFGSDPATWQRNRQPFQELAYRGLYPGIDLICRIEDGRLKSDFVVAPGSDPARIQVQYTGLARTFINPTGALILISATQAIAQQPPVILQMRNGHSAKIEGAYRKSGPNTYGFSLGRYDRTRPLIIDPLLTYSSLLGGTGVDAASSITLDGSGNIYLAGSTDSIDFPVVSSALARGGGVDAFIAKLDPTGTRLLYCTYLGGIGDDRAAAIAVDFSGNAYVAGTTSSANFPVLGPFQAALKGAKNAFIVELNASGAAVFSTYFGGSGSDSGNAIALGPNGGIYVAGSSTSTDLPVKSGAQLLNRGRRNAFVAQLSPFGTSLVYCTYVGGTADDSASAMVIDAAANVYIAGSATSTNFPVINAVQSQLKGLQNAFVLKLSPDGQSILNSTYLGGSGGGFLGSPEMATGLAVDNGQNIYVAGMTSSPDFPVLNPAQLYAGGIDAFVVKLGPAGQMIYSTFLGGSIQDFATAIAVDASQNAYVTGYTASIDFPSLLALQASNAGLYDAFITKLDAMGQIAYSTYLGASGTDVATSIHTRGTGRVYIAGQTGSFNFPVVNPLQSVNAGALDAFVAVLMDPPCSYSISPSSVSLGSGPNTGSFSITTGSGCGRIAVSNAAFLSVLSGSSGIGSGTVTYSIAANPSGAPRTGTLIISGGQAFSVTQAGTFAKVGVFRNGVFWLQDVDGNQLFTVPPDRAFPFGGSPGDVPITGDWSGNGSTKVGVYRNGYFLLDYNGDGVFDPAVDKTYNLGVGTMAGDIPVVGDWNGDGTTKVGLFRQGYYWILDYNGNGVFEIGLDKAFAFGGAPGDVPVIGDWTGTGTSKVGLFRAGFFWLLDTNGNGQFDPGIDDAFPFGGAPGDVPVVGDWNGDGRSKVGLFRAGYFWVLDANGNHLFDGTGPGQDLGFAFGGIPGDKPIVGKW